MRTCYSLSLGVRIAFMQISNIKTQNDTSKSKTCLAPEDKSSFTNRIVSEKISFPIPGPLRAGHQVGLGRPKHVSNPLYQMPRKAGDKT